MFPFRNSGFEFSLHNSPFSNSVVSNKMTTSNPFEYKCNDNAVIRTPAPPGVIPPNSLDTKTIRFPTSLSPLMWAIGENDTPLYNYHVVHKGHCCILFFKYDL